jgi:hypothetical protein
VRLDHLLSNFFAGAKILELQVLAAGLGYLISI